MKQAWMSVTWVMLMAACGPGGGEPQASSDGGSGPEISNATNTAPTTSTDARPPANPLRNAYFGDMHIHTRNSFDAYIFNVRVTPDDAYNFARGEALIHPSGYEIKLGGPPLDFLAVTDHGAYLGILPAMDNPDHPLSQVPLAQQMFSTDPAAITNAFQTVGATVRSGEAIPEIDDREYSSSIWRETIAAADRHYQPGTFTTFSAYEYTSVTTNEAAGFGGGNLHRNVLFKDGAPDRLFSVLDSTNPEDLWDWMDTQRAAGLDVIAVPHNSNVSDGLMFALDSYEGLPLDAAYAEQRLRNEPLVEITQVKGTSETHPALSPNDEWANFEIYEALLGAYQISKISGGYVREALARGIALENGEGFNPFKFGLIASSDTHVAGGAFDENDYWSKVGLIDGLPVQRGSVPPGGAKTWEGVERLVNAEAWFSRWSASGLAGVWAEENTREAIFAAMRRKETFATSGGRIRVRLFAGLDYEAGLADAPDALDQAYAGGVPMGGELTGDGRPPSFFAWAIRDPRGAPLQRLQIVKSWADAAGDPQEAVYDIACADGRAPDGETHRCADNEASVDPTDCSLSAGSGAAELKTLWQDPAFDPSERAAYYVRVLENPTCRWSTWDALRAGTPPNPDIPATLQERAWTSPIWYAPSGQ